MSQSTAGTAIATNAVASARTITAELRIAWGRTADTWPTDWTTQSTDETAYLRDVSWDRTLGGDTTLGLGQGPVASMRVTLDNAAQRFSPFNSSSAIYASLSTTTTTPGGTSVRYPTMWQVPVRLRMGFVDSVAGAQYLTMFSGLIDRVDESFGLGGDAVTLTVLDRGAALLDRRYSSLLYDSMRDVTRVDDLLRIYVSGFGGIATGTLDRGTFLIPFAWLDDEALWSEVQLLAASDGGYAFFDELGVFQYKNAAWWARDTSSTVSQATLTTSLFQTLTPAVDYENMATGALVEYQPRAHGGEQVVWRSDGTIVLPPGSTTIQAKLQYPVSLYVDPAVPGDWLPVSPGGIDMSASVSLDRPNAWAQRTDLVFTNNATSTVFIPKMQLRGHALLGGPQEQVEENVTSPLVPRKQQRISGNAYIQTKGQAQMVALLAASRMRYPRLTYITAGPALPWLQLGDRVTVSASPLSSNRTAIVTSLAFSWRPDAPWLMTVTSVDTAALFEYDNYHVVGTTNYGAGSVFV